MITLRKSNFDELEIFTDMAAQPHAKNFILQSSLQENQKKFADDRYHYLTIQSANNEIAGYFILAVNTKAKEVEFARICIDQNHLGIGQQSIALMEQYCREQLNCESIWLDVFEDNFRGIHTYEKLGYKKFKQEELQGRQLLFYRKPL